MPRVSMFTAPVSSGLIGSRISASTAAQRRAGSVRSQLPFGSLGTVMLPRSKGVPNRRPTRQEFVNWLRRNKPHISREASGFGAVSTGAASSFVTDLASAYKTFLAEKAAIDRAKAETRLLQAQASAASRAQTTAMTAAPTYGGSFLDTLTDLPLPMKLAGGAALAYLMYSLVGGTRGGKRR